jgi:MFS transporter, ACS family, hexuronate transporter
LSPTRPIDPTDPIKPSAYLKWWVCALLLLASTLNYMDRQTLSQTGVRISGYFQLSHEQFGSLEGVFNAAFAIAVFFIGWMADRWNVRLIYPTIVLLWSLAGFAAGFAESFTMLLVCRFALGLFEAGNIPCGVLTVKRVLRPEERALGNGMFQSGSALGAIITPLVVLACLWALSESGIDDVALAWQLPFRVVGIAGIAWALLWLLTVKSHHVAAPPAAAPLLSDTYWAIWRNRRFWVSLIVVVSINSAWRSFGFRLPKLLQQGKGYSERETAWISSGFFAAADAGSLLVGVAVLWFARRGMRLSRVRLICFTGCTGLTAISLVVASLPRGWELIAALMLLGFGALGLFPIYYALSQEISSRHQGKVTGTLSCLNAAYLALLFPLQGKLIDHLGSFAIALGVAGLFPIVGLIALAFGWREAAAAPTHSAHRSSDTAN